MEQRARNSALPGIRRKRVENCVHKPRFGNFDSSDCGFFLNDCNFEASNIPAVVPHSALVATPGIPKTASNPPLAITSIGFNPSHKFMAYGSGADDENVRGGSSMVFLPPLTVLPSDDKSGIRIPQSPWVTSTSTTLSPASSLSPSNICMPSAADSPPVTPSAWLLGNDRGIDCSYNLDNSFGPSSHPQQNVFACNQRHHPSQLQNSRAPDNSRVSLTENSSKISRGVLTELCGASILPIGFGSSSEADCSPTSEAFDVYNNEYAVPIVLHDHVSISNEITACHTMHTGLTSRTTTTPSSPTSLPGESNLSDGGVGGGRVEFGCGGLDQQFSRKHKGRDSPGGFDDLDGADNHRYQNTVRAENAGDRHADSEGRLNFDDEGSGCAFLKPPPGLCKPCAGGSLGVNNKTFSGGNIHDATKRKSHNMPLPLNRNNGFSYRSILGNSNTVSNIFHSNASANMHEHENSGSRSMKNCANPSFCLSRLNSIAGPGKGISSVGGSPNIENFVRSSVKQSHPSHSATPRRGSGGYAEVFHDSLPAHLRNGAINVTSGGRYEGNIDHQHHNQKNGKSCTNTSRNVLNGSVGNREVHPQPPLSNPCLRQQSESTSSTGPLSLVSPSISSAISASFVRQSSTPPQSQLSCASKGAEGDARATSGVGFSDIVVLHDAIVSLYNDRIRPYWREVQRRLKESNAKEYLLSQYKAVYETLSLIFVVEKGAKGHSSWAVYLREEPPNFKGWVDPFDETMPYTEDVWTSFLSLITDLMGASASNEKSQQSLRRDSSDLNNSDKKGGTLHPFQFRGGRYHMASEIEKENYAFLEGLSLGEICHLVQRAIDKGLLTYEDDLLQPVSACTKVTTAAMFLLGFETDASQAITAASDLGFPHLGDKDIYPIKDRNVARDVLKSLLDDEPVGLMIGTLKLRIVERFSMYICPTLFGHTRLSPLLAEEFSDVCRVFQDYKNRVFIQSKDCKPLPHMKLFTSRQSTPGMSSSADGCETPKVYQSVPSGLSISFLFWSTYRNLSSHGWPSSSCTSDDDWSSPPSVSSLFFDDIFGKSLDGDHDIVDLEEVKIIQRQSPTNFDVEAKVMSLKEFKWDDEDCSTDSQYHSFLTSTIDTIEESSCGMESIFSSDDNDSDEGTAIANIGSKGSWISCDNIVGVHPNVREFCSKDAFYPDGNSPDFPDDSTLMNYIMGCDDDREVKGSSPPAPCTKLSLSSTDLSPALHPDLTDIEDDSSKRFCEYPSFSALNEALSHSVVKTLCSFFRSFSESNFRPDSEIQDSGESRGFILGEDGGLNIDELLRTKASDYSSGPQNVHNNTKADSPLTPFVVAKSSICDPESGIHTLYSKGDDKSAYVCENRSISKSDDGGVNGIVGRVEAFEIRSVMDPNGCLRDEEENGGAIENAVRSVMESQAFGVNELAEKRVSALSVFGAPSRLETGGNGFTGKSLHGDGAECTSKSEVIQQDQIDTGVSVKMDDDSDTPPIQGDLSDGSLISFATDPSLNFVSPPSFASTILSPLLFSNTS